MESLKSRQFKPETYHVGATEIRKIGPELWFVNESHVTWTHLGNFMSAPDKTIRALRENGFDIPNASLDFLISSRIR